MASARSVGAGVHDPTAATGPGSGVLPVFTVAQLDRQPYVWVVGAHDSKESGIDILQLPVAPVQWEALLADEDTAWHEYGAALRCSSSLV